MHQTIKHVSQASRKSLGARAKRQSCYETITQQLLSDDVLSFKKAPAREQRMAGRASLSTSLTCSQKVVPTVID